MISGTLTGIYNVLERLHHGEALSAKDKVIHTQGLVSVLKSLHDELDAAAAGASACPPSSKPLKPWAALAAHRPMCRGGRQHERRCTAQASASCPRLLQTSATLKRSQSSSSCRALSFSTRCFSSPLRWKMA